jgi:GH15 family glucan-1,4-alpha-glucosidase
MCWVALEGLIGMHESGHLRVPSEFRQERDALRAEIERRGYSENLGSYVTTFDGTSVDASLLLLGRYGYQKADHPRMKGTWVQVDKQLGEKGLLHRYRGEDGLPSGEGAFGICSFWAVGQLARQGSPEMAASRFERLLTFANDLGLFAEEIHPETGAALGNFPQSFTHVGLIDAALVLEEKGGGPHSSTVEHRNDRFS